MASQERSSPTRPTTVTAASGPSAPPSVPPVMNTAMASERRGDDWVASTADWGWNHETPSPPTIRTATRAANVGARPIELMKPAATSGPRPMSQGRRRRSDSSPKSGCENDEESEASATSVPTMARFMPRRVASRGSSGEKNDE
jgi:hypothetical protein